MIAHNFPQYFHPFVGRKTELSDITERLLNPDCRLLTIAGPGGIGKTRLAVQASLALIKTKTSSHLIAQDGVYFVALQGLISSDFNLATN